jgi:hypothetical protein
MYHRFPKGGLADGEPSEVRSTTLLLFVSNPWALYGRVWATFWKHKVHCRRSRVLFAASRLISLEYGVETNYRDVCFVQSWSGSRVAGERSPTARVQLLSSRSRLAALNSKKSKATSSGGSTVTWTHRCAVSGVLRPRNMCIREQVIYDTPAVFNDSATHWKYSLIISHDVGWKRCIANLSTDRIPTIRSEC